MAVRWYLPPAVWALLLLAAGRLPDVPAVAPGLPLDKLAHLLLYGVLGLLAGRAWRRAGERPHWAVVLLLAAAVGAVDELHQASVSGRSSELADLVADGIGVTVGFVAGSRMRRPLIRERND